MLPLIFHPICILKHLHMWLQYLRWPIKASLVFMWRQDRLIWSLLLPSSGQVGCVSKHSICCFGDVHWKREYWWPSPWYFFSARKLDNLMEKYLHTLFFSMVRWVSSNSDVHTTDQKCFLKLVYSQIPFRKHNK